MMRINLLDRGMLAEAMSEESVAGYHARKAELLEKIPVIGRYLAMGDRTIAEVYGLYARRDRALAQYDKKMAAEIMREAAKGDVERNL